MKWYSGNTGHYLQQSVTKRPNLLLTYSSVLLEPFCRQPTLKKREKHLSKEPTSKVWCTCMRVCKIWFALHKFANWAQWREQESWILSAGQEQQKAFSWIRSGFLKQEIRDKRERYFWSKTNPAKTGRQAGATLPGPAPTKVALRRQDPPSRFQGSTLALTPQGPAMSTYIHTEQYHSCHTSCSMTVPAGDCISVFQSGSLSSCLSSITGQRNPRNPCLQNWTSHIGPADQHRTRCLPGCHLCAAGCWKNSGSEKRNKSFVLSMTMRWTLTTHHLSSYVYIVQYAWKRFSRVDKVLHVIDVQNLECVLHTLQRNVGLSTNNWPM